MKRVLLVYDVDGWAWHGMARAIRKYAPAEFEVTITSEKKCPRSRRRLASFDAVLWFAWFSCPLRIKPACRRLWTVMASHRGMYDYNPDARWTPDVVAAAGNLQNARERLPQFSGVIAKNRILHEFTQELNRQTVYLPSGVDVGHWKVKPISPDPPLRVAWCGQNQEDNPWRSAKGYMQVFRPLVERLNGQADVVFHTNTASYRKGALTADEMIGWYHGADVFLCTSSTEGAPLPVFEAAACGRPVVSTSVGAVPELVTDGQTGFLLGTFANQEEASAVVDRAEQRLLELAADRRLLETMSQAIRRKIETDFNWKYLARSWLEALMTVPEQPPAGPHAARQRAESCATTVPPPRNLRSMNWWRRLVRAVRPRKTEAGLVGAAIEETLARKPVRDIWVIEIGANDGQVSDPLFPFLNAHQVNAVLVEPVPYLFDMLRRNYREKEHFQFLNLALDTESGTRTLYYFDAPHNRQELLETAWGMGLGSFNRNHYQMSEDFRREFLAHQKSLEVGCITFDDLAMRCGIPRDVDILQIDIEGHDCRLIPSIDFARLRPHHIIYENRCSPAAEKDACELFLFENGYEVTHVGGNSFARSI